MIPSAMMTLIKYYKWVISDFNVSSSKAIEKHLRNHCSNGCFFHFIQKLFASSHHTLNSLPFCLSLVLIFLTMNANNLGLDIFYFPRQMYIVITELLPQIFSKAFVLNDACQSSFYSLCLLFNQLNSIRKKYNLLGSSKFAQIIIHGANGNSCLTSTSRKINDAIFISWILY